ncbi:MAG: peptidylprolyl isomerase [Planctomycetes bacterium]|nr:peptidylprolyl isomerase [Planctomycetota bacterium]
MKRWIPFLLLLVSACGNGNNTEFTPVPTSPEIRKLRELAVELLSRPDAGEQQVEVQQIQVGVNLDSSLPSRPSLTMAKAEQRAAEVLAKALDGEDFDKLVYQHSWQGPRLGVRPGTFLILREATTQSAPSVLVDDAMSPNLRNAVWRLKPGEVSAVEYHRTDCEEGYFILRRLTDDEMIADNPANLPAPNEQVAAMRKAAADLAARPEVAATRMKVQHILVGRFAPGPTDALKPLNAADAEARAAELFAKAITGADFGALVKEASYDGAPGIYDMTMDDREDMVKGFWQGAWRLQPNEIGIVPYHRYTSPFGYHIIKRLE